MSASPCYAGIAMIYNGEIEHTHVRIHTHAHTHTHTHIHTHTYTHTHTHTHTHTYTHKDKINKYILVNNLFGKDKDIVADSFRISLIFPIIRSVLTILGSEVFVVQPRTHVQLVQARHYYIVSYLTYVCTHSPTV